MRRTVLLTVLALALLQPRIGDARSIPRGSDDDPTELAIHLPLDTPDERMLLIAARRMPAVQTVMQECQRRGYVAHPEGDRAAAPELGYAAVCFLTYEKPGYVPPPNSLGAPVIMVATLKVADGYTTRVSCGFVILDGDQGTFRVYDPDVGGYYGQGTSRTDAPGEVEPDRWYDFLDQEEWQVVGRYALCAGIGNAGCIGTGMAAGSVIPAVGIGYAMICTASNTKDCLDKAFNSWPQNPAPHIPVH